MNDPSKTVVLITGASSGFGLITTGFLASRGYRVIATLRNMDRQKYIEDHVSMCGGGDVEIEYCDVTQKDAIQSLYDIVQREHGRLDVLINNAGFGIGGFFEDLEDEEIRAVMETNFFGAQSMCRAFLPMMRTQKSGKIVNISSVAGFSASPAFSAYNASKWALEAFSESLRYELEPFGIGVFLVEPGTFKTNIFYRNIQYAKLFNDDQSPYYERSQFLKKRVMDYVEGCKKDPLQVARLIERIIQGKARGLRHRPDIEAKGLHFLRKCLPFGLYSWILMSALKSQASK